MNLHIEHLTIQYAKGVKAIDDLSLEIRPGMFGLLGPNGAGKSSLMRTLATLQRPQSGRITFKGRDIVKDPMSLRRVLGYLPQSFGVYPNLSAEQLLDYLAELKGVRSAFQRMQLVGHVLELTNLSAVRNKRVDQFSGGMKQRFGIAQLLLNDPELIIVDEPTAGLDPAERTRFLQLLREIGSKHTVLFSTHIVEDVKELCHEMAILDQGKLQLLGTPQEAVGRLEGNIWIRSISPSQLEAAQSDYHLLSSGYQPDNSIQIRVYAGVRPGAEFQPASPQLEDVYFLALDASSPLKS
jgi:ABC-type multidrug transport system ATPase subunit